MKFYFENTCVITESDLADILRLCKNGYDIEEAIFMGIDEDYYRYQLSQIYDQLAAEIKRRLGEKSR